MSLNRSAICSLALASFVTQVGASEYCDVLAEKLQPGQVYAAKCAEADCLFADPLSEREPNVLYKRYNKVLFISALGKEARNSLVNTEEIHKTI